MERFKIEAFEVTVSQLGIILKRDESKGNLVYQPAEVDTALSLLLHCMSIEKLKYLPEKLSHSPFEVKFDGYRVMHLRRDDGDESNQGVALAFEEGDDLIEAIKQGANKHRDLTTIQGGARGGYSSMNQPDPVIEGR